MLKHISSHASRFFLLVTQEPNFPFIIPLLSSTNWASSNNWSWDQLSFRLCLMLSSLSFIMIGGLERGMGCYLKC